MYEVRFTQEAARMLVKMPRNQAELIRRKIDGVAIDPHRFHANVKPLTGRPGYRLRVGNWRVIYDLNTGLRVLAVERIASRGSVYS